MNEDALYAALSRWGIRGAACDVFVNEPPRPEHPLLALDNFIATPHVGGSTEEALYRMGTTAVTDIFRVLDGKAPLYGVR